MKKNFFILLINELLINSGGLFWLRVRNNNWIILSYLFILLKVNKFVAPNFLFPIIYPLLAPTLIFSICRLFIFTVFVTLVVTDNFHITFHRQSIESLTSRRSREICQRAFIACLFDILRNVIRSYFIICLDAGMMNNLRR